MKKLHNVHVSPNIRMIKSKRMKCAGHAAVGKPTGMKPV
jgi:hypothetical protein